MSDYPMLISNKLHSFRNFCVPFLSFGTMNLKIGHSLVMPDRLFYHAKSNLCICLVFHCKGNSFSLVKQFLLCT